MTTQTFNIENLKEDYLLALDEEIKTIETELVQLEKLSPVNFSTNLYDVFRKVHSFKGSAGSYEFYMLATIFHRLEDHISYQMQIEKEDGFIDLCFKYIDTAKNCIIDYQNGAQGLEKYTTIIDGINVQDKYTAGKMLLIEPSLSIRKIFQKAAEDNKLELTILNNGATALNRIIHESYDLIVASAAIEILDGESLLKGLKVMKTINQKTPMLLISGDPQEQLEDAGFGFILKDIDLLSNIDTYLKENIVNQSVQSELVKFNYKNVVFVEDDKMIQLIIKKLFEDLPETTLHLTGDYSSSMQAILEHKPDLIVLDYFLKDCVGVDILEQVFKIKGKLEIPILFMTSTPEKINIESLKDWGNVKGIIQKPIKAKALLSQIAKLSQ